MFMVSTTDESPCHAAAPDDDDGMDSNAHDAPAGGSAQISDDVLADSGGVSIDGGAQLA